MKHWVLILSSAFVLCGSFAQDKPAPKTFDEKVKAVEIKVLQKGAASQAQESLWVAIKNYWGAYELGDFSSVYDMFVQEFKDEVSLDSYLKRNRFDVTDFQIKTAFFWGDECARVNYRMQMNSQGMEFNKLPMRQFWVLRDNKWQLYENPYKTNIMFSTSKSKVKSPCPWPAKIDEDQKAGQ